MVRYISRLVPSNTGSCNGDSEDSQSKEQRDDVEGLERKASHSRCSARRNYIKILDDISLNAPTCIDAVMLRGGAAGGAR